MRAALALLLCCSTAYAEEVRCPDGARTTLSIEQLERPKFLRHDQPIGRDRLIMRASEQELAQLESDDFWWMCLGFSPERGHLVGAQGEYGAAFVLAGIGYLREDATSLQPSVFTSKHYEAYSALVSPDGHWVAFVGGRDGDIDLQVLDTHKDTIKRLGASLKPPPYPGATCDDGFEWGPMCIDGYTELEPELWHFEGDTLVVSYGKDSARRRAAKRKVRRYKL